MNRKPIIIFSILLLLTLLPIAQFYIIPYHPIESGAEVASNDASLGYEYGYTRQNYVYLLLWTTEGMTIDVDIQIRQVHDSNNPSITDVEAMYDVTVGSNGLRIIYPLQETNFKRMLIQILPSQDLPETNPYSDLEQFTIEILDPDGFHPNFGGNDDYSSISLILLVVLLDGIAVYYRRNNGANVSSLLYPGSSDDTDDNQNVEDLFKLNYKLIKSLLVGIVLTIFGFLAFIYLRVDGPQILIFVGLSALITVLLLLVYIIESLFKIFRYSRNLKISRFSSYLIIFCLLNLTSLWDRHIWEFKVLDLFPYAFVFIGICLLSFFINSNPKLYRLPDIVNRWRFRFTILLVWVLFGGISYLLTILF